MNRGKTSISIRRDVFRISWKEKRSEKKQIYFRSSIINQNSDSPAFHRRSVEQISIEEIVNLFSWKFSRKNEIWKSNAQRWALYQFTERRSCSFWNWILFLEKHHSIMIENRMKLILIFMSLWMISNSDVEKAKSWIRQTWVKDRSANFIENLI